MIAMFDRRQTSEIAGAYREMTTAMDRDSRQIAIELYAAWSAGSITDAEFGETLAYFLFVTGHSAKAAADGWAATLLGRLPLGLGLDQAHMERLAEATATMTASLDATDDLGPRLGRLLAGEALSTFQQGVVDAYDGHGVKGYTRGLSATACELCNWLYKDGYIYPTDQPMHQHPGCTCVPIPTTK